MAVRRRSFDVPPWLRAAAPALAVVAVQLVAFPVSVGAWFQGLVIGLLNALVVLGMMLVYRANRVINMAQASIGALPAALGIGLVLFGGPSLAVAGWLGVVTAAVVGAAVAVLGRVPTGRAVAVGVGAGVVVGALVPALGAVGYLGGLVLGLIAAVVLGLAIDLVVVRRFRRSPRLVLTVATIGLAQFLAVGSLLIPRLWGRSDLAAPNETFRMPGSFQFDVGTTVFHLDEVVAVVVAVLAKDNYDTFDMKTTAGSLVLQNNQPPDDAYTVKKIRDAGGIIIGKANMDEFAFGFTGSSSLGGKTKNAYVPANSAGGSSSGTGTSIAARTSR